MKNMVMMFLGDCDSLHAYGNAIGQADTMVNSSYSYLQSSSVLVTPDKREIAKKKKKQKKKTKQNKKTRNEGYVRCQAENKLVILKSLIAKAIAKAIRQVTNDAT